MDTRQRIESLRKLQHLLDNAFRVPGTSLRFGWDPILGAVPWVGDLLAALLSCAIVVQAHHMRVPRVVQARMLLNTAIDVLIGLVPVAGDVADVFWKSNAKNFLLLEHHAADLRPPTVGDHLFVGGILLAVIAIALAPLVVVYWLSRLLRP
jgi:Domain of unknown function (DUF4112)